MSACRSQRRKRAECRELARIIAAQSPEQLEATRAKLAERLPADYLASAAVRIIDFALQGHADQLVTNIDAATRERPDPRRRTQPHA
jgi:hypothetical protein